jgi:hypothetical protein
VPAQNIMNPILTAADVSDVKAKFVADPFMINTNNKWFMFFEVLNSGTSQKDIALATSSDGLNWTYEKIVLDEPFHLSYPCVFKDRGNYYMIPESYEAESTRLYKAVNFPFEWKLTSTLISGMKYVDSIIFQYDSKWWIFTETAPGTLRLYYANDLNSHWTEHPLSPVVNGNDNIARPAGRVILNDDKLIRFAQDGSPTYGNQVRAFEINRLTISEYIERELCTSPVLESMKSTESGTKLSNWRSDGMHHLDPHQIGLNKWIACVDGMTIYPISFS